jgi:DNA polymerase-3 subunit epsilon
LRKEDLIYNPIDWENIVINKEIKTIVDDVRFIYSDDDNVFRRFKDKNGLESRYIHFIKRVGYHDVEFLNEIIPFKNSIEILATSTIDIRKIAIKELFYTYINRHILEKRHIIFKSEYPFLCHFELIVQLVHKEITLREFIKATLESCDTIDRWNEYSEGTGDYEYFYFRKEELENNFIGKAWGDRLHITYKELLTTARRTENSKIVRVEVEEGAKRYFESNDSFLRTDSTFYIQYMNTPFYYEFNIQKDVSLSSQADMASKEVMSANGLHSLENDNNSNFNVNKEYYLFFDTETTGLPKNYKAPITDFDNWPRLVQIAYVLYDEKENIIDEGSFIIKPLGFYIPYTASSIHGITTEIAIEQGVQIKVALDKMQNLISRASLVIGHNVAFDERILGAEFLRNDMPNELSEKNKICTMLKTIDYCGIKTNHGFKYPKLDELYYKLFKENFKNAHNAINDVKATAKCFWELKRQGIILK